MPSRIAWLDASREEQQRMREILNLFTETESRDELGIGQIRDAFSDSLFPGTSTLHTRARYFLLIPWCFQDAEHRRSSRTTAARDVDRNERMLIIALKKAGDTDGLIGQMVGAKVKNLPSALYWSALGRYGIRLLDGSPETLAGGLVAQFAEESQELVDPAQTPWSPTIPAAPPGFPDIVEGGLELSAEEAHWLAERILDGAAGSLLAHLLAAGGQPDETSAAPWNDPCAADPPAPVHAQLVNAELFSLTMHGAALLYNLLVAERYDREGYTRREGMVDHYREQIHSWAVATTHHPALPGWDRDQMWNHVVEQNERIAANAGVRHFVDGWLDAITAEGPHGTADSATLRRLVGSRERGVKRSQSRLVNARLLRDWSGASGSKPLTYRWGNVKRLLWDMHDGREAGNNASS